MTEILALLQNIAPVVSATILQQMSRVIYGMCFVSHRSYSLDKQVLVLAAYNGEYRCGQSNSALMLVPL